MGRKVSNIRLRGLKNKQNEIEKFNIDQRDLTFLIYPTESSSRNWFGKQFQIHHTNPNHENFLNKNSIHIEAELKSISQSKNITHQVTTQIIQNLPLKHPSLSCLNKN